MTKPTQYYLKSVLFYRDGNLYWKEAGKIASKPSTRGYRNVFIDGTTHPESRLVWIFHHGDIPDGHVVHHADEVRDNNRIENLEIMTKGEHVAYHKKKEKMSNNPKKKHDDPNRKETIALRVTAKQKDHWVKCAKSQGLSISSAIRWLLTEQYGMPGETL